MSFQKAHNYKGIDLPKAIFKLVRVVTEHEPTFSATLTFALYRDAEAKAGHQFLDHVTERIGAGADGEIPEEFTTAYLDQEGKNERKAAYEWAMKQPHYQGATEC